MTFGRSRFFQRRMGRDVGAWPMLALLLLVVLVAIGCVLWFMREAMRNERLAVRQKLTEAWRAHLTLAQQQTEQHWNRWRAQLDGTAAPDASDFESCVRQGLADSVVCLNAAGDVVYPRAPVPTPEDAAPDGEALKTELRALAKTGDMEATVQFVIERFGGGEAARAIDAQGRLVAANAELMALERLAGKNDPRFAQIASRLHDRVTDYTAAAMPSAQRRFLMHELQRLTPDARFPTRAAEELAAQFLEAHPSPLATDALRQTELRDVWSVMAPSRRVIALLTTSSVRAKLAASLGPDSLPPGVRIATFAPGEHVPENDILVTTHLGAELGDWRLALALDNRGFFDTAADKRVARYLVIGSIVIAALTLLGFAIARGLRQQVQLASLKNDLVANVSHELKTPLTSMRVLVDSLLESDTFDVAKTREYLQLVAHENARLSRLIDNFLTFSRLERGRLALHLEPLAPQAVVDAAAAAIRERCRGAGCQFETQSAPTLPAILADRDALTTAVLNLLDNALKYSGEEKRILLSTTRQNGHVCFAVKDNGIGLAPDEKRRVFGRFYQVDDRLARVAGGCGLGLSIVDRIATAHHGSVRVESEPGRGSTFTIEIPIAEIATT